MWFIKPKTMKDEQIKGFERVVSQVAKKAIEDAILSLNSKVKSLVTLNSEIEKLEKKVKDLELQKTMDEREVKQLVKIKQENQEVEYEKKVVKLDKQYQEKEMKLQTEYHDKVMKQVAGFQKEMKDVYDNIMSRLPNLNASLELVAGQGTKKTKKTKDK